MVEDAADAALIVRVVNCYDELVAALADVRPALERLAVEEARANRAPTGHTRTAAKERLERVDAALASAKGEPS